LRPKIRKRLLNEEDGNKRLSRRRDILKGNFPCRFNLSLKIIGKVCLKISIVVSERYQAAGRTPPVMPTKVDNKWVKVS
jgi:hypothetical protein